jgi:hypothetical protein
MRAASTPIASNRRHYEVDVISFKLCQRRLPRESLTGGKFG